LTIVHLQIFTDCVEEKLNYATYARYV